MEKVEINKENYNLPTKTNPSWSNLPLDLLCEIMQRNEELGHLVRAVCKKWMVSYVTYMEQLANKLPRLLIYNFVPKGNSLYEFSCHLNHSFSRTPIDSYKIEYKVDKYLMLNEWSTDTKHGWLLLPGATKNKKVDATQLFLWSVLTKEVVQIPILRHGKLEITKILTTFSYDPISHNFLVIVCHDHYNHAKLTISTITLDPKHEEYHPKWITNTLNREIHFFIERILYTNETLYCVTDLSNLAAYNIATKKWEVLESYNYQTNFRLTRYRTTMIEIDGDLLVVMLNRDYKSGCIRRFDFGVKHWVEYRRSFKDWAIFIGETCRGNVSSSCTVRVVEGMRSKISGNKVYYVGCDGVCRIFSFTDDGKFVYNPDESSKFSGWNRTVLGGCRVWIEPSLRSL